MSRRPSDLDPDPDRAPFERVEDQERMLAEMNRAIREALAQHKRAGNPVAVWRDGQVVWIAAEDIPDDAVASEPSRGERDTAR